MRKDDLKGKEFILFITPHLSLDSFYKHAAISWNKVKNNIDYYFYLFIF